MKQVKKFIEKYKITVQDSTGKRFTQIVDCKHANTIPIKVEKIVEVEFEETV